MHAWCYFLNFRIIPKPLYPGKFLPSRFTTWMKATWELVSCSHVYLFGTRGGRNRMWLWVSVVNFVNVDCMFVCAPSIFGMLGPSQLTSVHSVLQFPTGLHVCWTLSFHWAACSTAFFRAFSLGCMWGRFDWWFEYVVVLRLAIMG